jgi:ATP-dependent DNA ligase
VVVGWTDPEGTRPWLGALLLAYYDPDGRLVYAGRVGTGIDHAELQRLWRRLRPLATPEMPLDVAPPRTSRFGAPLVLSRVHWVRPELVAEVKCLIWTEDNLLRQVVYEGLREDKPAAEVRRSAPHSNQITSTRPTASSKVSVPVTASPPFPPDRCRDEAIATCAVSGCAVSGCAVIGCAGRNRPSRAAVARN